MKPGLLFYLEGERLSAWHHHRRQKLAHLGTFTAQPPGIAAFSQFLAEHRGQVCHLLVNSPGEQVLTTPIPPVRGRDRQTLIARKLEQLFPGQPLRQLIAAQTTANKSEILHLAAVQDSCLTQSWLPALHEAKALLGGIYTLSQLAAPVLEARGIKADHCLVLSTHASGFRAIQLVDRKTVYTRFCNHPDDGPDALASALATEARRLREHLGGDAPPSLVLIAPAAIATAFRALAPELAAHFINDTETPHAMGSEAVFLHALAEKLPSVQFASPALLAPLRQARQKRLTNTLSAAALAASASYALYQHAASKELTAQTLAVQQQTQRLAAQNHQAPADLAGLQQLAQAAPATAPAPQLLPPISRWLDQETRLTLLSLDWEIAPILRSTAKMQEIARLRLSNTPAAHERAAIVASLQQAMGDFASVSASSDPDFELIIERELTQ